MSDDHDDSAMLALIPANPAVLAVPGGIPAKELHCTLAFLGDEVSRWSDERKEALRSAAETLATPSAPIVADVFSHATWNADRALNPQGKPTEPSIIYQLRDAGPITALHHRAVERLQRVMGADFPQQWAPYLPHIAGAYGEADAGKLRTKTGPINFTTLRLVLGAQRYEFPLSTPEAGAFELAQEEPMAGKTKSPKAVQRTGDTEVKVDEETGTLQLHWPCLVLEGMETGDGRFIPYGSLGHRGLPLPVAGQTKTAKGHDGAEVFGKITKLERHEGPTRISKETGQPFPEGTAVWEAWGEADAGTDPDDPGQLAIKGYLTGNSADLAEVDAEEELADDGKAVVQMRGGKIAGTTLVPIPAFADGFVEVNGQRAETSPAVEPLVAAAEPSPAWTIIDEPAVVTASGEDDDTPFRPPLTLFQPRQLHGITPLTLETQPDGTIAVYGHAADFARPHISFSGRSIMAPRSPSKYAKGFNTGALRVLDEDGTERTVAIGRLTYGDGHAPTPSGAGALTAQQAKAFYDNPDMAWAWVQASDDAFGIQVNGVVIPGTPDARVTKALAHPVSGDWRPMDGRLELVAAHCVNTAGIPVPRQLVASGEVMALVAAGAVAPAPDNPTVLATSIADQVLAQLAERLPAELTTMLAGLQQPRILEVPEPTAEQAQQLLAEIEHAALTHELGVVPVVVRDSFDPESLSDEDVAGLVERFGHDPEVVRVTWMASLAGKPAEVESDVTRMPEGELANWVEKAGGLPPYIKRIAKHLQGKGKDESQAIATAVNVVKKMCSTGDVNFPGKQQVNAGSQAEACAAVKSWEAKKAQS